MRKLFQLVGEISVTGIDVLNKQFGQIDKEAQKLQRSISKLGNNIEKTGKSLSKAITAPLVGLGAAMVVAADKTGKYADEIFDLVDITGLSTDSLQELEHVARVGGVDFNGLTNTITQFTGKLPEIVKEGGKAYNSIKALGINIYDTNGNIRDMNQLFPEMLKALMNVSNVTERNALATTIFGRSLNDLAPVLGMTAEGFDAAIKEAHDLNLVIGGESLKTANNYHLEMKKLSAEFTNLWRRIAIDFVPVLKDTVIPIIRDTVIPVFQNVIKTVKSLADWFIKLPQPARETIVLFAAMSAAAGPFLIALGNIIKATKVFTSSALLMNAALLANPFVLAAAAIVAIGAGIYYTVKAYDVWKKSIGEDIAKKQTAAIKRDLELIIPLYGKLALMDREVIGEENFKKISGQVKELETNLADLGVTFEGNFGNRAVEAENKLTDLRETIKETSPAVNTLTGSLLKNEDAEKKAAEAARLLNDKHKAAVEWEKKLIEQRIESTNDIKKQTEEKLKLLELEKAEALKDSGGENKISILEYYANEEIKIYSWRDTEIKKLEDESLAYWKDVQDEKADYSSNLNAENEAQWKAEQKKEEAALALLKQTIINAAVETNAYLSQIADNYFQKKFNLLEAQQAKEIDTINKSMMNEENKEKAIAAINKKYAKESLKLRRDQAKKDKAFAIFGATINTALGITNALQLKPVWLAIAMAAVMAGLGAIQIAAIATEPLPMKKGGLVKSGSGGVEAQIGEGAEDEIVLPMKTGVRALADALVERLKEIEIPSIKMPRFAYSGGATDNSIMRSSGINLHIGTLIADESGLKELERRLLNLRISEQQRKGQQYYGYR